MIERNSAAARKVEVPCAEAATAKEYFFPAGIFGFPTCRRYRLEPFRPLDGGASPFFLLSSVDHRLTLPVTHPQSVGLDYQFPADPELLAALHAKSRDELVPLLVVTVRDRLSDVTLNLQGPLILNPGALLGSQLVLEEYPLRHPLLIDV